jgi:hypothetical protein
MLEDTKLCQCYEIRYTYEMSMIQKSQIEMIIYFMRIEDQRNEMELISFADLRFHLATKKTNY